MRFYVLSDLHLAQPFADSTANHILKRLCCEIRKNTELNATILFIFLGDMAFRGEKITFEYAQSCLEYIRTELNDFDVKFEFVPGNHDLHGKELTLFDDVIRALGSKNSFENKTTYSSEYEGINFIFTDSNLSRDHQAQGKLDFDAIKTEIKSDKENVLFCHHALSHGQGDLHDTVEDSALVIKKLNSLGIKFFFHGHVHRADVTIPDKGLIEIGTGSFAGEIEWFSGDVQHQFTVGYMRDHHIIRVDRFLDNTDGNEIFASNQLFPERKTFADPNTIDKKSYESVYEYIPRTVLPYEDATRDTIYKYLHRENALSLYEVLQKEAKILLLCDAGMGKSVELCNLAHLLCAEYHTFLFSLKDYVDEEIINILPSEYRTLHPNRIALLLDGYDEISNSMREVFDKKLRRYLEENEEVHIVISSRSNFCRPETGNESRTFPKFRVYVLDELDNSSITTIINKNGIDEASFWHEAKAKKVNELLSNPFYLTKLINFYVDKNSLPQRNQLMDMLISEGFELDDDKSSGNLNDRYNELFNALEVIAFSMQLMHKYVFDDREEYQKLFNGNMHALVKQSGLFKREKAGWSFSHNNFREYLAAKQLAKLSKEDAISIFACGTTIKPSWVNTLGYLTGLELGWDLQGWLEENFPSALVKFESDRLDPATRTKIFKSIFTKYEKLRVHLNDDLFDTIELARFANNNETLSFLIDRIANPVHFISQYTALDILRHFTHLYDKRNKVRTVLLDCCNTYPKTKKTVYRLAIIALWQLKLDTKDVTTQLFEIFGESQEDYIRLAMYEYLIYTKELDSFSEYFLDGIKHIAFKLDNDRIGNESFELVNGLKLMSTPKSISDILIWFSNDYTDFHDSDKVLNNTIITAIELYGKGHTELYDVVLNCYLASLKSYESKIEQAMVKFFKETNTHYDAILVAVNDFWGTPHYTHSLLNCDENMMEFLKEAYKNNRINHIAFQNLVVWYIKDEKTYIEYAKLIKESDDVDIVEYKAPIDYELLKKQASQAYFDALLDDEKRNKLFSELLTCIEDTEVTNDNILELGRSIDFNSPLWHLKTAVYHYSKNIKISEFLNVIDLPNFILWSASKFLSKKSSIILTDMQRNDLIELLAKKIDESTFENPVKYYKNGFSIKSSIPHILSLVLYLDFPLSKNNLLCFSELPCHLFKDETDTDKYSYLTSKLSDSELKQRLIKNVATGKVKDMVLKEHIDYFDKIRDESLAEYALTICKENDSYTRYSAWQYLYHLFGAEYLETEVLPFADGEFLMEINSACKDINKERIMFFMEKQYEISPMVQLQAHLITLGREIALSDYVRHVTDNKNIPEGKGTHIDGPTQALRAICNPDFLCYLKDLLIFALEQHSADEDWNELTGVLSSALINCSKTQPEKTIAMINACCPSAEINENGFMYCNYIISDIQGLQISMLDKPMSLDEVQQIIKNLDC